MGMVRSGLPATHFYRQKTGRLLEDLWAKFPVTWRGGILFSQLTSDLSPRFLAFQIPVCRVLN